MATPKKTTTTAAERKRLARHAELTPLEQLADDILAQYSDLAPSVRRIVSAELTEDQRIQALTSFRSSLGVPNDPFRDPAYAIAHYADGGR